MLGRSMSGDFNLVDVSDDLSRMRSRLLLALSFAIDTPDAAATKDGAEAIRQYFLDHDAEIEGLKAKIDAAIKGGVNANR